LGCVFPIGHSEQEAVRDFSWKVLSRFLFD
jgi:hypothetical protein